MIIGVDGSRSFISERTGTENYSLKLLASLAKIDQRNTYLVFVRPGSKVIPADWPDNFIFLVIPMPILWTQLGLSFFTWIKRLDLLFVPSHTLPLFRPPWLKTVMTVHDLGAEFLPASHQLKQRLYLNFITKFQMRSATRLIAVSEATKDDIIRKTHCPPKQIKVIYEGVDQQPFKSINTDILNNILNSFDLYPKKYYLFVGTVQPRKNLIRLIEAFASISSKHPDLKLVIAGAKGWLSDEIYLQSRKSGVEDKVLFLGRVSDEQLTALYSGAIGLTFPSLYEGFGLPILEAFRHHCPVVTSDRSSMPEVSGGAAVLVNPYDVDSIATGLGKLLVQKTRSRLISLGLLRYRKFSWNATAKQTLDLFKEVVSE